VAPWRHPRAARGEVVGQHDVPGLDGQLAPVRHRIPRVDGKIQQDLLQLSAIGLNASQRVLQDRREFDILSDEAPEHLLRVVDEDEDYLYPASWFRTIQIPQDIEAAFSELTAS